MIVAQHFAPSLTEDIAPLLQQWQARWPGLGVMVLMAEAGSAQVPALQAHANRWNIPLVGALFPALITQAGFVSQGLWLLCFENAPPHALLELAGEQAAANLAQTLRQLEPAPAGAQTTLFTVFDAMVPNIGSLMEDLHIDMEGERHYLGVSAGSETFAPMPCLFDNQRLIGNGVLALLLSDAPRAVVRHEYAVSKSLFSATSTVGNRIALIDDRPAFAVYQELIRAEYGVELTADNFYELAVHFPFGLVMAVDVLVRIPVRLGDDGSLYCVGEIPERSMLRLLSAPKEGDSACVDALGAGLAESLGGQTPDAMLVFYCAGRKLHFQDYAAQELQQLQQEAGCSTVFGALSLGEIDSLEEFMLPRFHNAAIVCVPQAA